MKRLRVASDQPRFLPWGGFFFKMLSVDLLIYNVSSHVSYGKDDHYHNRTRLFGSWLTLALTKETRSARLMDIELASGTAEKAAATIRNAFGKKWPYQYRALDVARDLEEGVLDRLSTLNMRLLRTLSPAPYSRVNGPAVRVDSVIPEGSDKTRNLIDRIRRHAQGPVTYCAGRGALNYLDLNQLREADIELQVQTIHPSVENATFLQTIANDPDPWLSARSFGLWETLT